MEEITKFHRFAGEIYLSVLLCAAPVVCGGVRRLYRGACLSSLIFENDTYFVVNLDVFIYLSCAK